MQTTLVVTAWIATLLMSKLPLVIARDLLSVDIPWITPAWIGTAVLLFSATFVWQSLKPLRRYFFIMGVILLLAFGVDPMVQKTALWQNLIAGQPVMVLYLAVRLLLLLESLIVMASLSIISRSRNSW